VAYRRSVFETVGYFDETFDACEDMEFNHRVDRAGLKCFFTPKVSVRYFPRSSLRDLFCQLSRYGRGRVRLLRKHPETFSPASFIPAIFLVAVLAGLVCSLIFPAFRLIYASLVGAYLFVILSVSLCMAVQNRNLSLIPLLPSVFTTIHAGAGCGMLAELFSRRWTLGDKASHLQRQHSHE
jgi:succinoglycan biosynthesis protein ExoA